MILREPISPRSFSNLAPREVNFTLNLSGEAYQLSMASVPAFDHSRLTVVVCPEGSPCDVLLLPTNVNFRAMGLLSAKKNLRMFVPRLAPEDFNLNLR